MKWPLISRRRYVDVLVDRDRLRGERDQFMADRDAARAAARRAAEMFDRVDDELAALRIVNDCLTRDLCVLRGQDADRSDGGGEEA